MSDDNLLVVDWFQTVAQLRYLAQVPFNEIEAMGFIFLSKAFEIPNRNGCPHKDDSMGQVPRTPTRCPSTPGEGRRLTLFVPPPRS